MLEIVLTMFVVLFAFLAGGLWIGWTLAVTCTVLLAVFRDIPLDKLLARAESGMERPLPITDDARASLRAMADGPTSNA